MVLLASSYDQSRFLNAADLEREKKFRIKAVTEEAVGEKQEIKLVVWFTNDKRGLVLNKTNNRTIRSAFGDDVAGWKDKIIVIFPTTALLRGKVTPALRVRIPPPKQVATTAPTATASPQQQPGTAAPAATTSPPQQATTPAPAATAPPAKPAPSGNGAAAAAPQTAAAAVADPELEDDPVKPLREDLDDEIVF